MTTRFRLLLAIAMAPLLAASMCGQSDGSANQQTCQDAIAYLEEQCEVSSGATTGTCGERDQCVAQCVLDASCGAFNGADSAAAEQFDACSDGCSAVGGSGASPPSCRPCAAYFDGVATYDEVCEAGQQLLDAWSACICAVSCEVVCFEHCQGFDPNPMCSECVLDSCAAQTQACQSDN